eukprot:jgi/Psemu1/59634/gm1.59634_g
MRRPWTVISKPCALYAEEEPKIKADEWIKKYQRDSMGTIYRLSLGQQVNEGMKTKLAKGFGRLERSAQRCPRLYGAVLRALGKLGCTQQRGMEPAAYVKTIKNTLEVLKSRVL